MFPYISRVFIIGNARPRSESSVAMWVIAASWADSQPANDETAFSKKYCEALR